MTGTHEYLRPCAWRRPLALAAVTFLMAGIAAAEDQTAPSAETTAIHVRYERGDLASPAGARRLLVRIGNAALESCGASAFSLPELKNATLASQCYKDALAEAVRRIDSPLLTAAANEEHRKGVEPIRAE